MAFTKNERIVIYSAVGKQGHQYPARNYYVSCVSRVILLGRICLSL